MRLGEALAVGFAEDVECTEEVPYAKEPTLERALPEEVVADGVPERRDPVPAGR
ncbi:hypothetical protein OEIGOIKO_06379 [Streptomyces chrestomyceticus JCM 4735]|uniref:Uncharacterized protein n=1 Tax=Streptomyces chrestomyceticus JCM 4735 TaxID=1306181 RepID=A0A7U9L1D7_9ACTN|nr:hypothetical protein [Streptomyces chrestomyceticus]GCD38563.1 hypothetical protein OEIGOIKO_06379 [Streptomyces chrestomyceticus JCM 4735]